MNPERAILADCEALARVERALATTEGALVRAALSADARYLRGLIDRYEASFFELHGLEDGA